MKTYLSFMQSLHRRAIHIISRSPLAPQYCMRSVVSLGKKDRRGQHIKLA